MQLAGAEAGATAATIGSGVRGAAAGRRRSAPGRSRRRRRRRERAHVGRLQRSACCTRPGASCAITVERGTAQGRRRAPLHQDTSRRACTCAPIRSARASASGSSAWRPISSCRRSASSATTPPPYKAGLRTFDIVTAIHGRPVATSSELDPLVHAARLGHARHHLLAARRCGARLRVAVAAVAAHRARWCRPTSRRRERRRATTPACAPADTFVHAVEPGDAGGGDWPRAAATW